MPAASNESPNLLRRSVESGRIHSAYLLSGPGSTPRDAALEFVRALVCQQADGPCETCIDCRRSSPREPIALDGTGRKGPLLRHVGDHADLFWIERGHVACAAHTPFEGSDTWLWERWEPVPPDAATAAHGAPVLRCETCGAEATR